MAQVASLSAEIATLNTNIVAISFGTPYWANAWLETTQSPFPLWLDPQRKSYAVYGMTRSYWAPRGPKIVLYYMRAILFRGQKLQPSRGDTHQLGGNFIIDKNSVVRLAYPSRDPTDRPSAEQLMGLLHDLP